MRPRLLKLLKPEDLKLLVKSKVVKPTSEATRKTIADMKFSISPAALHAMRHKYIRAHGMAAIQFGIPKRIFLAKLKGMKDFKAFINPLLMHMVDTKYDTPSHEGCFSCEQMHTCNRSSTITMTYYNEEGVFCWDEFEGLDAIILQHEYDHLDGILISNHDIHLSRMRFTDLERAEMHRLSELAVKLVGEDECE